MSQDYMKALLEERNKANAAAREIVDRAIAENRALTAEDNEAIARADADYEAKNAMLDELRKIEAREAEVRAAVADAPEARGEHRPAQSDEDALRSLARGEVRSFEFERRDVVKSATGAPVPTTMLSRIMEVARFTGPMLETSTILNTAGGESLQIPRTNAYSTGSVTAEADPFNDSDPTFQAFLTLGAFKESTFFQVSTELLEDNGVDLLGYFSTNVGQAIGYIVNDHLTDGTGTTHPTGIVTSAGSGITSGTTGTFAYDDVVDLVYSTDAAVRRMPGFGIMGSTSAIARMRKLVDGSGAYVWQPSLQLGEPDRVLGYRVWENPHMATVAAGNKALIAGDLGAYIVRQVGGIRLDRSDDYAFGNGLVTFRATWRGDGGLPQSSHVKYLLIKS
jgi:HK97 family phage major capsid protein